MGHVFIKLITPHPRRTLLTSEQHNSYLSHHRCRSSKHLDDTSSFLNAPLPDSTYEPILLRQEGLWIWTVECVIRMSRGFGRLRLVMRLATARTISQPLYCLPIPAEHDSRATITLKGRKSKCDRNSMRENISEWRETSGGSSSWRTRLKRKHM